MREIPYRYQAADIINNTVEDEISINTNMLALMFRQIKNNKPIDARSWSAMMNKYLKNESNKIPQTNSARSSESSNLYRALATPEMPYKIFIKGLRLLNVVSADFRFTLNFEPTLQKPRAAITRGVNINREELYREYHNTKYPDRKNELRIIIDSLLLGMGFYRENEEGSYEWTEVGEKALDDYVIELGKEIGDVRAVSERSYLVRTLQQPDISIKVFTKALEVINPINIEFRVKLTYGNNKEKVMTHFVTIEGRSLTE